MNSYRRLWLCWWGATGALGLLVGFGTLPVLTVIGVSSAAALLVGAVAFVLLTADADRHRSAGQLGWQVVRCGLGGALLVVTIIATSVCAGPLAMPLLALAAVTSPWTVRSGLRLASRPRLASDDDVTSPPSVDAMCMQASDWAPAVQMLTDEQLCVAWCASYTAMQSAPVPERAALATLRHAYLEDLERRNPAGLRAWLDSGARAAGNPSRHLAANAPQDDSSQPVSALEGDVQDGRQRHDEDQ
jgi:hypothetical protein